MNECFVVINPTEGRHGGDVMKLRLANAALVFMQSPKGNEMLVKRLGAGGADCLASYVATNVMKISWILAQPGKGRVRS